MTKTKERSWINTDDHQTKKHKTTTQGSGNPQPPEKIPPFRFRFPTDDAVRRYEDCISKRSLCMERGFTYSESNYFELMPIVTRLIKSHKWEKFCQCPSPASIPLVREFYANYDPKMPHSVRVRGKLVDASASAINSVYSLTDHQNTFYEAAFKFKDISSINCDILEELTGKRVARYHTFIPPMDLKEGPGIWINFINYNLFPTYENKVVSKNKAILLYCIMVGKPINVGKVIAKQIRVCARFKTGRSKTNDLWFPALITRLCERHNVLPANCEPVKQPDSDCIREGLVERTVNESEPDQQTTHSDYDPTFPEANTSHQSQDDISKYSTDKLGCGPNLFIPAEATENAPSLFNSSRQSPLPTPQATSSQPLPPVSPSAPSAVSSTLPQTDLDELSSPLPTTPATSSQQVPPVAPSSPPAEPLCPPQTDLDELPALPIKVSSPQCGTICVQGYNVKRSVAPVLEAIFKKHGDIAAECPFKTASARSYFLEVVCEVVTRIETDDVIEKMEEIKCQVSDAEAVNINVSWLRAHLEAVHKRKEAMKKSDLLMETKVNTGLVKRAAQMDLRERCEELVAAQERFEKAERCARVLHLVENNLKNAILESKAENALLLKQRVL